MGNGSSCFGQSHFTEVNGLRTHALVGGAGDPLVIVPGLGCASWMYTRLAGQLAQERTVYVYDPPGHGWSAGTWAYPTRIEHLTAHLAAWLRQMGLSGAALLGHSLGGEVILDLAVRCPGVAGALVACAPTGIPENPSVPIQLLRLLSDLPRERLELLRLGFHAYSVPGVRRLFLLAYDQRRHLTGPLLGNVTLPTLLVSAGRDPVVHAWTIREIQRHVPQAEVQIIPGAPHALTDACPHEVARVTLDFLKRLESLRNN
ncbi:alpha/beta fold hydrolase [Deinococcus fonticola]|uniref:alpha/beta fold hydrolase n=1 Tax=Deinococcus fonticola TaxID=2528713 RepID=UPI0010756E8C|nr:alpha/beta hydrolase [Deinococcus fonticola]